MKTMISTTVRKARLALAALTVTMSVIAAPAQGIRPGAVQFHRITPEITLEVKQFSGEFTQWIRNWSEADPQVVTFRWATQLKNVGSAQWQVLNGNQSVILASGNAGAVPAANTYSQFHIDFRNIAGVNKQRPLTYWVRVVVFSNLRVKGAPPRPAMGVPVKISFVGSGPVTQFTFTGLRPELLHTLPLAIDLQTLKVVAGGDGQEPYLFAVMVYADGTTIKPKLIAKNIEFPNSSVRIDSAPQTHGNVTGDSMNENGVAPIPAATGHFETFLHPVGFELKRLAPTTAMEAQLRRQLRQNTFVGIVVVGMEEGSVPSTKIMDEVRAEMLSLVQSELDKIILGIKVPVTDPSQVRDAVLEAVRQVMGPISDRLKQSAKAKTMDQFVSYLKIPGGPAIMGFLGIAALNHDEFVGSGVRLLSYQELLDAGEAGITFDLNLANEDNDLRYTVRGRTRVR
jgi:hypothetical protein